MISSMSIVLVDFLRSTLRFLDTVEEVELAISALRFQRK